MEESEISTMSALSMAAFSPHESFKVLAADLFFSFDQEFHIYRQRALRLEIRFNRFQVNECLSFVVRCAPCKQVITPNCRFERRRGPEFQGFGRLHIIVAINQKCRFPGGIKPIGIDNRMALCCCMTLTLCSPDPLHVAGKPIGATSDIRGTVGISAYARNSEQFSQFLEIAFGIDIDVRKCGIH